LLISYDEVRHHAQKKHFVTFLFYTLDCIGTNLAKYIQVLKINGLFYFPFVFVADERIRLLLSLFFVNVAILFSRLQDHNSDS